MRNSFINAVEISKGICQSKLANGDTAVDCTMGNGNDTAFLCSLVGEKGKVYAFDIQEEAVISTRKRLKELNILERSELILDGHETIDKYIKETVKLVIFNLGYLPKGNHSITTKKETTLVALQKCLCLLEPNGIILIIIYPGHENGKLEKEALESYTASLSQKDYNVVKISFQNQINFPPELICIEKVCPK
ncbi:class I SAM-dependent methyltransferase [Desulfosporosinus sp.]|uniref:class I SAM-dependent methyltransferase n=1 Tax=Desulfosporosinus sp. TaxID=157907 RepID=UPI000E9A10F0|nr:class I SAM-dependent methyltransferase [Desulfosporosinus sp.]MBC2723941.1 class I SAM-dependent methyltransferase [Desulfosporosinus sp.]MBC2728377.1 class I SAM-dependent methyltransferase [Desulfosporosinus sp.]HBV85094.1 SAM-dependent methyltransferase [Desulfosporosinus sp.]